jgi:hypothetical protein
MKYSIDYYSYTIPTEAPFTEGMFHEQQQRAINIFRTSIPEIASYSIGGEWEHEHAQRFYSHRWRNRDSDVALSYGQTNAHVLVEFAGKACNFLAENDLLLGVISITASRCSRIDFAVDIECKTSPKEFIAQRSNKSFRSSGNKYTPTGGTEYLGGRTSERMARVYRYYEPHPRHNQLRVEAEYKGSAAKASTKFLLETDIQTACLAAHKPFQWRHPQWKPDAVEISKIPYSNYNPSDANTIRWLYGDVVTALRKAIKGDLIDFEEWLAIVRKGLF